MKALALIQSLAAAFRFKQVELSIRRGWFWVYLLAASLLIYFAFSNWGYDDPFILYRYSDNLRRGLGFVYNPGERVLSSTTPLFTVLLALLSFVWDDIPCLAVLTGAFSLAAGAILLWDLARTWQAPLAGWAGLFIYPTFPLLLATLSSEVPLYLAFCLAAFAFFARQRYRSTAVFCALASLTRPDGLLVTAVLAAGYFLRRTTPADPQRLGKTAWQATLIFFGLFLPWVLFALAYFGSPVPVTLAAKQQQGLMEISTRFAPGFLALVADYAGHGQYWLQAGLALAGLWLAAVHLRSWLLLLSWTAVYFCAYSLLGVSRYFWYYSFLVPGWVALVGLGIAALQRRCLQRLMPHSSGRVGRLSLVALVVLIAALALSQASILLRVRQMPDARLSIYRQVGEWLASNTPAQSRVGMLEVGIIGYYSHRPVVDFSGLIQPEVAELFTPSTTYADAAHWAVETYRPDYLVLHDSLFSWLEQVYVPQHCRPVKQFVGASYGYGSNLTIFACPREPMTGYHGLTRASAGDSDRP